MKTSTLNLLAAVLWTIYFAVVIFTYDVVPKYLYLIVIGVIICGHLLDYFALKGEQNE